MNNNNGLKVVIAFLLVVVVLLCGTLTYVLGLAPIVTSPVNNVIGRVANGMNAIANDPTTPQVSSSNTDNVIAAANEPATSEVDILLEKCSGGDTAACAGFKSMAVASFCPEGSTLDPYGDAMKTGVLCEYEINTGGLFHSDGRTIIEDWIESCPTGALCEGVWVATKDFTATPGTMVHGWVFINEAYALARFPTHACEYVAKTDKGHSMANVRVPFWATGSGYAEHSGCPIK